MLVLEVFIQEMFQSCVMSLLKLLNLKIFMTIQNSHLITT